MRLFHNRPIQSTGLSTELLAVVDLNIHDNPVLQQRLHLRRHVHTDRTRRPSYHRHGVLAGFPHAVGLLRAAYPAASNMRLRARRDALRQCVLR
ncbi:uncharacterized protein A1O5_13403 [Cladophialophora psammophila CBS 110553]|uniref:Uncharacterized protein n=1 Tax=Cladophialophora psammophila CBS 110553 TaxID=1182543 RepID=W9VD41_9EURO|nr:uncharacterized protein A1O5_13403 [Cladophialophora psammophila CBS 110553]EXJ53363.1 hypothetical protein A1O5_13403 [Cladophialophora psammophila CBS 110553]